MPTKSAKKSTAPARDICTLQPVTIIAPSGFVEAIIIPAPIGPEKMKSIFALGDQRIAMDDRLSKRWGVRAVLCERDWARWYIDHPASPKPDGFVIYI